MFRSQRNINPQFLKIEDVFHKNCQIFLPFRNRATKVTFHHRCEIVMIKKFLLPFFTGTYNTVRSVEKPKIEDCSLFVYFINSNQFVVTPRSKTIVFSPQSSTIYRKMEKIHKRNERIMISEFRSRLQTNLN